MVQLQRHRNQNKREYGLLVCVSTVVATYLICLALRTIPSHPLFIRKWYISYFHNLGLNSWAKQFLAICGKTIGKCFEQHGQSKTSATYVFYRIRPMASLTRNHSLVHYILCFRILYVWSHFWFFADLIDYYSLRFNRQIVHLFFSSIPLLCFCVWRSLFHRRGLLWNFAQIEFWKWMIKKWI